MFDFLISYLQNRKYNREKASKVKVVNLNFPQGSMLLFIDFVIDLDSEEKDTKTICVPMILHRKKLIRVNFGFQMSQTVTVNKNQFKYLSITLDSDLNFSSHRKYLSCAARYHSISRGRL